MEYLISFYHDTRRSNKKGTFPVKLNVYSTTKKKKKLYDIKTYYSIEDFNKINSKKPPKAFLEQRRELDEIKNKAEKIAKNLSVFNFEDFERDFNSNNIDQSNIVEYYHRKIEELEENGRIKSKIGYETSLKSIQKFIKPKNPSSVTQIHILDITPKWLNKYERHMLEEGKSISTIGIYLRDLRAIYNIIIENNPTYKANYPFEKYKIPSASNTKKALNPQDLKKLFLSTPKTSQQETAKDFFMLSFLCNGININDIAHLKFENLSLTDKRISFYRGKTKNTKKSNLKNIDIYLTDKAITLINKHKNKDSDSKNYVFPILDKNLTEVQKRKKIENFTRFINQHLAKLAEKNGLPKISTYWARHSYSNTALNNGASVEFISEALGYSNIKVTQNYIKGFDNSAKEDMANKIASILE